MGIKDSIYCSELCIQVMQLPPVTPTESVCEDWREKGPFVFLHANIQKSRESFVQNPQNENVSISK